MKKIILILLMVAAGWSAAAQFREVLLLREGERQIGFNVGTSYGYHQWLAFRPQAPEGSTATISRTADSMVRNNLGYQVGFLGGMRHSTTGFWKRVTISRHITASTPSIAKWLLPLMGRNRMSTLVTFCNG